MLDTEIVTSRTGLTEQQVEAFARRYCSNGHKFRGYNWPTPDGQCPLCLTPELQDEIVRALTPEDQRADVEPVALPAGILATTTNVPQQSPLTLRTQLPPYSERAARLRRMRRQPLRKAGARP